MNEFMLSPPEASRYCDSKGHKVAVQTLAKARVEGTGPAFRRSGRRIIYTPADLDAWIETRRSKLVRSTAELAAP